MYEDGGSGTVRRSITHFLNKYSQPVYRYTGGHELKPYLQVSSRHCTPATSTKPDLVVSHKGAGGVDFTESSRDEWLF